MLKKAPIRKSMSYKKVLTSLAENETSFMFHTRKTIFILREAL